MAKATFHQYALHFYDKPIHFRASYESFKVRVGVELRQRNIPETEFVTMSIQPSLNLILVHCTPRVADILERDGDMRIEKTAPAENRAHPIRHP